MPRKLDQDALAWADISGFDLQRGGVPSHARRAPDQLGLRRPQDLPLERVREIRDDIDRHDHELLAELDQQDE